MKKEWVESEKQIHLKEGRKQNNIEKLLSPKKSKNQLDSCV